MDKEKKIQGIHSIETADRHYVINYGSGEKARINIVNSRVFRYYMSPTGEFLDYPEPNNPEDVAKIIINQNNTFVESSISELDKFFVIQTDKIDIIFDKTKGTMQVSDKQNKTKKKVLIELQLSYANFKASQILYQHKDEQFFGGGMQNGRFTHKGQVIDIVNTNNWTDGGVSSPCPFYWSSYGYGVLRNTWQPGIYDFGSEDPHIVKTSHKGEHFDAFYIIDQKPKDILNHYYKLTGQHILMPEYAFYQAHLNAFNRDYWVRVTADTPGAILFEDGFHYKCYQPSEIGDKKGILESLNGENDNYQFSARAMIDRYKRHDMPLGWFIPNDGYGSGYGQTDSLDGDIQNLKEFADYARENNVEAALWTESNLHPEDPANPKKGERDLRKEVTIAGVVALKCDVAWIGSGYSFGLNAVEYAAKVFVEETKHKVRPMIITVDGWAGTQRYAGIWSGDQIGGQWEYIRFHIPTYIGTGLSGQSVVGSDMDGIFGGGNKEVNIRDYQWKTFTPLQLNMDGWGNTPKTPFSFDQEATSINRAYLKLKSMLMPYNYSLAHESIHGLPMIRAMFLEFPEETTAYTKDSQYQFMWGPNILVAPVYSKDSTRNGIYLPNQNQVWVDLFTGEKYQGGKILNDIPVPIWKIPVFVRDGAILPMCNPNNNPYEIQRDTRTFNLYPNGENSFELYEDDGISSDYLDGNFAITKISTVGPPSNQHGKLLIHINKTKGSYKKMLKNRTTLLRIMASKDVVSIKITINGTPIQLHKVEKYEEFELKENVYYFQPNFILNPYLTEFGGHVLQQKFILIKIQKTDITTSEIQVNIKGYENITKIFGSNNNINQKINPPYGFHASEVTFKSITLNWQPVKDATYYEIEREGVLFTNITGTTYNFDELKYDSQHSYRIRSTNDEGFSLWSDDITVATKEDPHKNVIKNVKVSCNLPCQPYQEICKLTDGDTRSLWHTNWGQSGKAKPEKGHFIKLNFDLGDIYEVDKMEYVPREDAGNGIFLQLQYSFSSDGVHWSPMSEKIKWNHNADVKIINLKGAKMRFVKLVILESIGQFGSGKQVLFYKIVKSNEN